WHSDLFTGAGSDARAGREDAIVRIFAVDPAAHRYEYARPVWIHIKNGRTPEFLAALNDFVARAMTGGRGDERFAFQGKKEHIVYDFAADFADYPGELYDFVSVLCGLDRESITLSERHF